MFERLIDLIAASWASLRPALIVLANEEGVILRWGRFHRRIEPGLRWKWPLIETVWLAVTVITTLDLRSQTLTTKDGVGVVVSAIVKYQIKDPKPFLTEIWDSVDVLRDVAMGAIKQTVATMDYVAMNGPEAEATVLAQVRQEVSKFGFKIHRVTFTDMGRVKSLRLINHDPTHQTQVGDRA